MNDAPPAEDAAKDLPDPSHPDFTYESSPHLYLFTSLTAGSSQIITATSRLETILKAHRIPFHAIDTATDDKARKIWARRSAGKKLPGLVRDGYVVADLAAVEEWNEYGELKDMLGAKGEGGAAQPLVLGGATPVTGKENAKAMAKAGYGVSGPAAEGIDTSGAAKSRIGAFEKRSSLGGEQQVQQKQSALAAETAAMGSVRANRAKFEAAAGGGGGPAMFKRRIPSGAPKAEPLENKKEEPSAVSDQAVATETATAEDKAASETKTSDTIAEPTTVKADDRATSSAPPSDTTTSESTTVKTEETATSSTAATDTVAADPEIANTDDPTTTSVNSEPTEAPVADTDRAADTTTTSPVAAAVDPPTTGTSEPQTESSKSAPHTTFDTSPPHTSPPPLPEADPTSMSSSPPSATATIALPAIPKDELPKEIETSSQEKTQDATQETGSGPEAPAIVVQDAETGEEKDAETIAKENEIVAQHAEADIAAAVEAEGQAAEGAAPAGGSQHVHFKGEPAEEEEPSEKETKVLEEKLEGVDIKAAQDEQKGDEKAS